MASRVTAAVLAAACLLVGATSSARAAATAESVARALRTSAVYVDPALAESVRPADREALLRGIRSAPRPVFVALVPLVPGDAYGGEARAFLTALHQRLGRPGIYATVADRILTTRDFGHDDGLASLAGAVANFEGRYREPATATLARFLAALRDPNLRARYEREQGRTFGPTPDRSGDEGGLPWFIPVAVLVALLLAGVAVTRRRRRARPAPVEAAELPRSVFTRAQAAADEEAREAAEREVLALAEAVGATAVPEEHDAQDAYGRALDAATVARRVLEQARGTGDLVGALVLAQDGRLALAEAQDRAAGRPVAPPIRRCAFDPRHGVAAGPARWDELVIPACRQCIDDLDRGLAPDALLDDGRPYLERNTVWARTAYGALDDDLLARVLRGEPNASQRAARRPRR